MRRTEDNRKEERERGTRVNGNRKRRNEGSRQEERGKKAIKKELHRLF